MLRYTILLSAAACRHHKSLVNTTWGRHAGAAHPNILDEDAMTEHVVIQIWIEWQPHLHSYINGWSHCMCNPFILCSRPRHRRSGTSCTSVHTNRSTKVVPEWTWYPEKAMYLLRTAATRRSVFRCDPQRARVIGVLHLQTTTIHSYGQSE